MQELKNLRFVDVLVVCDIFDEGCILFDHGNNVKYMLSFVPTIPFLSVE